MYWRFHSGSRNEFAKAEEDQVLYRVLAQIMVNPENVVLPERPGE